MPPAARAAASFALLSAAFAADPVGPTLPWGVHLALGGDAATTATIMWSTRAAVAGSVVSFAPAAGGAPARASGEAFAFSDGGNEQTLHRVRLAGLAPGTRYAYSVGDGAGATSANFSFATAPADGWLPTIAVFGDMGISANALATMPWLIADAAAGRLDVVCHIGDAACAFYCARPAPRPRAQSRAITVAKPSPQRRRRPAVKRRRDGRRVYEYD